MNIRDHVLAHIRAGGNAKFAARVNPGYGWQSGVLFYGPGEPPDGTFIPVARLGYSRELGYFDMGKIKAGSECVNGNPFTVHPLVTDDDRQAFALLDDHSFGYLLGERYQMADALAAIRDALAGFLGEPIPDDDPALGVKWLSTTEAIAECRQWQPLEYKDSKTAGQRLRAAAREGRIRAMKDGKRWLYKATSLRGWMLNEDAHKPGPKGGTE